MARRNPSISSILSARGYGARVLWPKYTPDGGINSGSEIPVPPRNTLQSNQSNLIYHENPFTPVTRNAPGRIEVTSKRGKTLYMTENQIRKMGEKMLAPGEIERALGRSNPKRPAKHSSKFSSKRPIKSVPKGAGRNSGKGLGTGLRSFGKQAYQAPDIEQEYAHELFASGGKQLEQYLANMSEDEQSKFTTDYADMLENPNVYRAGKGKFRRETQKSMHRAQHEAASAAEAAGYFYPRSSTTPRDSKFHQKMRNMSDYEQRQIAMMQAYSKPPKAYNNPFWVTPQGTAVHHSDKAWIMYQGKNEGARLPAQASREALLERQPTSLAPGFTVRVESMMTSNGRTVQAHKLFYKGRDTGKYALDGRKAIEISHAIDPETGKRRKA